MKKKKYVLEMRFETQTGLENFRAWYLDGGGEQDSGYYSDKWGKSFIDVKCSEDDCPKCEFQNDNQTRFWENRTIRKLAVVCSNCTHAYVQVNPYQADGT